MNEGNIIMGIFKNVFETKKVFAKKEPALNPTEQVLRIMQGFIEASFSPDNSRFNTAKHGELMLTFMFGAIDMLSQKRSLDTSKTIWIFEYFLQNLLGNYSPEQAHQLAQFVIKVSDTSDGQQIMIEGGNSMSRWINGDTQALQRLNDLLLKVN